MIWYRISTNSLIALLGLVILLRALPLGAGLTGLLIGGGLLGLGIYRVHMLLQLRRERR